MTTTATQQAENNQIDQALYAIDGVMHGETKEAAESCPYFEERMVEMREIIRGLLATLTAPAVVA